jgi:hypothetical protein
MEQQKTQKEFEAQLEHIADMESAEIDDEQQQLNRGRKQKEW